MSDPDSELELTRQDRDEAGWTHLKFAQRYQGLRVWPAGLGVHLDPEGTVTLVDGAYGPTPELAQVSPAIASADTVGLARDRVAGGVSGAACEPELIVNSPLEAAPRLAWKFGLTVDLAHAWRFVVDARNGRVLHRASAVLDTHVPGSGLDLEGATRLLNVWEEGGTYYLADTTKPSFDPAFDPIRNPRGSSPSAMRRTRPSISPRPSSPSRRPRRMTGRTATA